MKQRRRRTMSFSDRQLRYYSVFLFQILQLKYAAALIPYLRLLSPTMLPRHSCRVVFQNQAQSKRRCLQVAAATIQVGTAAEGESVAAAA